MPVPPHGPITATPPLGRSSDLAPLTGEEADWLVSMLREAQRLMHRRNPADADDVAQEIAAQTARKVPQLLRDGVDPQEYARRRAKHAGISWDRAQRAQRGEGVRLRTTPDGLMRPRREVVSGDATHGTTGTSVFALLADGGADFEARLCDALDAGHLVQRLAARLTPKEAQEVLLVDGHGIEVREVARAEGQARETVSRRVNRTRTRIVLARAELLARTA